MKNKTIANCLITVLSLALIGGVFDIASDAPYYTFLGLGFFIFAIIAIVRLYKLQNKEENLLK